MKADQILRIIAAVLAAVVVLGVLTFAGPCVHEDGSVSTCHGAQVGVVVAAAISLATSLASFFVRGSKLAGVLLLIAAAAACAAALCPGVLFPLCMMNTMRCHVLMQPFAQFVGGVAAVVALIAAVRSFRAKDKG